MAHGYSLLEVANFYEKQAKELAKITKDIMTNNTQYYGVISIAKNFDLLIALVPNKEHYAVDAIIFRGWPESPIASSERILIILSKAIKMFPEIRTIKYLKEKWPKPYNEGVNHGT